MYVMDYKISKDLHKFRDKICQLVEQYLLSNRVSVTDNKKMIISKAVGCFVGNLPRCGTTMGITLDHNHYSEGHIVNGRRINRRVSHRYTVILFDCLTKLGYIDLNKGYVDYNGSWHMVKGIWEPVDKSSGYIELKDPLIDMRNHYEQKSSRSLRDNVVVLRDKCAQDVTFRITDPLKEKVTMLNKYNKFSLTQSVLCNSFYCDVQMYKVFNIDFNKGGRSFMSGENNIQSLSKEQRKRLTIEGKATCCYDYQGFEPSLLYSMEQEIMDDDPYHIDLNGYDKDLLRKVCKGILLRMINTEHRDECYKACLFFIAEEFNVVKLHQEGLIPQDRIAVRVILECLEDKHDIIMHRMYKGYGLTIQNVGSAVNDYVVEYFVQRSILPLQIHDAFIVDKDHESDLQDVMHKAFDTVLGFSDNVRLVKEF